MTDPTPPAPLALTVPSIVSRLGTTLVEAAIGKAVEGLEGAAKKAPDAVERVILTVAASALRAHGAQGVRALIGALQASANGATPDLAALSTLSAVELSQLATALQTAESRQLHAQVAGLRVLLAFLQGIGQAAARALGAG